MMKKDSFIRGMFAAYAAIVITKVLGVLYSIPFYDIIGENGGVIYSCVYNIYALFLDISTCGIPVAVSIIISEYHTLGRFKSERKAYSTAFRIVTILSLLTFTAMQLFARSLSLYFLKDMSEGASPEAITLGIRIISFCMLIVPFLSLRRGLLQGYKYVAASSRSQIIEQFIRIVVALAGSYVTVRILGLGEETGVNTAFTGTVLGALVSLIYVTVKSRSVKKEMLSSDTDTSDEISTAVIIRRLISICVPIIFVSLTVSIYSVVDMKLILVGLHNLGYEDAETQIIASVASTWAPKICMLISALPTGIVSSIVPFMAESNAEKNREVVGARLNQALGVLLVVSVPMAAGMILLRRPLYTLFYNQSQYGPSILALLVIVNLIGGIASVMSSTLQSIGFGKAVFLCTFAGIVINVSLDLPLIYLYDRIGIPSYLGAATASIIGQLVTVAIQTFVLKRRYRYSSASLRRNIVRILIATAIMSVVVLLILLVWPAAQYRGVKMIVQFAVYAIVGIIVYFIFIYFSGTAADILGRKELNNLLDRFHIRTVISAVMFFPALWAGKLVLLYYTKTNRRRSDKPGMASMILCSDFLRFIRKPPLTIAVTGTNGKSSISNMVANMLIMSGKTVAFNDWGANHYAGNARCLLDAVDIFNRSTMDAAVIELDEKISPDVLPYIKPDYIIVNNIARDSMLRNATVEFISGLLRKGVDSVPDSVVVINSDDPLCSSIGKNNRKVYFGAEDLHTDPYPNLVSDFTVCPVCGAAPVYRYRNFRHIGDYYCPQCGFSTPERDLSVLSVDPDASVMTVRYSGRELVLPLISSAVFNIYNEASVAALFLDMGITGEDLAGYLKKTVIPSIRETDICVKGINVYSRAAKGRNTTAVSSVLENISKEPGVKELILALDELYAPGRYETASWIYENDYEYLNRDDIRKIIIFGENRFDHRTAMLMCGIPADKIICIADLSEAAGLVDIKGIDSIYLIHDILLVSRFQSLRDTIKNRIEGTEEST